MIGKQIWFIARSDFKERIHSFPFLALCALSVFAVMLFVPDPNREMTSIAVDTVYFLQGTNWTWIPVASALCTGMLLPVTGFFYLRNSLALDRKTGIVNLIYTSPVNRLSYLAGKYLANLCMLLLILVVVINASFCMTLIHFPDSEVSIFHFLSFFVSLIPGIFLCSAIALVTEAVPVFQGRSGSWAAGVLFFVTYVVCLATLLDAPQGVIARFFDMTGFVWLKDSIDQSVYSVTGNPAQVALGVHEDGIIRNRKLVELFFLPLFFSKERVIEKSCMILSGMALCAAASFVLPRYEIGRKVRRAPKKAHGKSNGHGLLVTEFILTFRNCSAAWYMIMLALWFSMFFAGMETAQRTLWTLAIAWSCLLFSDYGCRERKCNLHMLLPTFYRIYVRQLLIRWCVGAVISVCIAMPVILRLSMIGEVSGAAAGIIAALLIPALSVFLGKISGSERTFEVVILVICYLMLNGVSFIG